MLMYSRWKSAAVLCALVVLTSSAVARAQEAGEASKAGEPEEAERKNEVALFLGVTHVDQENAFTFGFDYERPVSRWIGVGGIVDFERGEIEETLFGPALLVYPGGSLVLTFAPLVSHREAENEFAFRFGFTYKFEIGRFFLGPQYNLDILADETAHDFGVSTGVSF